MIQKASNLLKTILKEVKPTTGSINLLCVARLQWLLHILVANLASCPAPFMQRQRGSGQTCIGSVSPETTLCQ